MNAAMSKTNREVLLGKASNYLLVKDDVGRAKPTTRNLPSEGFAFGRPDNKTQEPASIITTSWQTHSSNLQTNDRNPRNF